MNGDQGVIIPEQNVDDLMLKEEIITAVNEAKFHIYSVKTVAEGIELLTGLNCGKRESDGNFTEGSVFRKVQEKLENTTRASKLHKKPVAGIRKILSEHMKKTDVPISFLGVQHSWSVKKQKAGTATTAGSAFLYSRKV